MCHEAYEASLMASDVHLKSFFSNPTVAIPIVESHANFFRPMHCGDKLHISLDPALISPTEFSIDYDFAVIPDHDEDDTRTLQKAVHAFTRHVAIDPAQRKRTELPDMLLHWINQWSAS